MKESVRQLFQTTQCSWCESFYTTALFMCPYRKLQSNCNDIKVLSHSKRAELLKDEMWLRHAEEMFRQLRMGGGVMARCINENCLAANPNPQKTTCWRCHKDLTGACGHEVPLDYDIGRDLWTCPKQGCTVIIRGKDESYLSPSTRDSYPTYDTDKEVIKRRLRARRNAHRLIAFAAVVTVAVFVLIIWVTIGNRIRLP